MEVNKLEGREVMIIGFGGVILLTLVVLMSIYVGHAITVTSNIPTPVHVSAATPTIQVNVPQAAAPKVEVTSAAPNVNVHVPAGAPPTVNVSTPPATVTVLDKRSEPDTKTFVPPAAPANHNSNPPTIPASFQTTTPAQAQPAVAPAGKSGDSKTGEAKAEVNYETLYSNAERYIESYCKKNNLDANAESKKWLTKWNSQVETAVRDGMVTDEQAYINRIVVDKRDCFDLNAAPEKIVEGCRLMLRYRDAKLTWIQAMKDAATTENMQKTLAFLAAGVK
jgi:cytoskeletal protein RodZ